MTLLRAFQQHSPLIYKTWCIQPKTKKANCWHQEKMFLGNVYICRLVRWYLCKESRGDASLRLRMRIRLQLTWKTTRFVLLFGVYHNNPWFRIGTGEMRWTGVVDISSGGEAGEGGYCANVTRWHINYSVQLIEQCYDQDCYEIFQTRLFHWRHLLGQWSHNRYLAF